MMARRASGADSIVLGKILTLDADNTVAEGMAIRDGRIVEVGSREDILQWREPGTNVQDFRDRTIIPGFNDTHAHAAMLGTMLLRPSLENCKSVADILAKIRELAAATPQGEWIATMPIGQPPYYFDPLEQIAEKRLPTRQELDSAAPGHPVYIPGALGYWGEPPGYALLNSEGLRRNGLDRNSTAQVDGVELCRDQSGDLSGVIIERNLMSFAEWSLLPAVPRFTSEQRAEGLRLALASFNSKGTTSIYEGHGCAPDIIAAYRQLREQDRLTVRTGVVVSPSWTSMPEASSIMRHWLADARGSGIGDEMLKLSGIFVGYGGPPKLNALVEKDTTDIGWIDFVPRVHSPDEFEALCMMAGENNLRLHTIASDKLHEVVPILQRVARRYPIGERRWVIEHVSKADPDSLAAVKALGVGVTLIPIHYVWKAGYMFETLEGQALDLLSPAAALADLGVPVSAGTDAVPNDPLFCMWSMVSRENRRNGRIMGAGGRTANETALRLLTVNGAWLTFDETRKGPLKPGYVADLAVLSGNPLAARAEDLLDIHCEATMVGGRWVHGEPS